jgi:hypothetical protein
MMISILEERDGLLVEFLDGDEVDEHGVFHMPNFEQN